MFSQCSQVVTFMLKVRGFPWTLYSPCCLVCIFSPGCKQSYLLLLYQPFVRLCCSIFQKTYVWGFSWQRNGTVWKVHLYFITCTILHELSLYIKCYATRLGNEKWKSEHMLSLIARLERSNCIKVYINMFRLITRHVKFFLHGSAAG